MFRKKALTIVLIIACLGLIGMIFSKFETTMLLDQFNTKTGEKLSYKLNYVGGYDPDRQYIAIDHKGQSVRQIKYITKKQFVTGMEK